MEEDLLNLIVALRKKNCDIDGIFYIIQSVL